MHPWAYNGIHFSKSSDPEVFLRRGVLKICNKFTGEHPCRSVISIKLLLKSHFGMSVLLYICYIFSEHLFLETPLDGCFWITIMKHLAQRKKLVRGLSTWKIYIVTNFNFIEIALWHGCYPVNFQHIFRTPFPRNASGWLLLLFTPFFFI